MKTSERSPSLWWTTRYAVGTATAIIGRRYFSPQRFGGKSGRLTQLAENFNVVACPRVFEVSGGRLLWDVWDSSPV